MNIVCPKAKALDSKCETTLFQTNLEKSNVAVPKMIKWSDITLPEKWILDEVAPKRPLENQEPTWILQFADGEVEIQFSSARRTRIDLAPFRSNIEPHRSSTSSDRAYDLELERMVLAGLRRTQEQIQRPAYRFEQTIPDLVKQVTRIETSVSMGEQKSEPGPSETKRNREVSQAFFKPPPALDNKHFKMGRTLSEYENFVDVLAKRLSGLNLSDKRKGHQVSVLTEGEIDNLETMFKQEQPEINRLMTKKRFTQTAKTKNYYPRPTPVDLQFEEDGMWNSAQYDGSSIVEWNIDGLTKYHIINTMKHMMMYAIASKIKGNGDRRVAETIIVGFVDQLKGWWDFHLSDSTRTQILNVQVAIGQQSVQDPTTGVIKSENVYQEDAVNSLIYTITLHFVGTIELQHDRSRELLMNLKCPTLSHFRWYKDVFYSKVFTRQDYNVDFWKEKFLSGLPILFAEKVRNRIKDKNGGVIPYGSYTYGELSS
ncbi:unnamed protein product [Prunus armeniaca]